MIRRAIRITLNSKLLIYTVVLLLATAISIGIPSYMIARQSLEDKGRTILMNGVNAALHIIEEKNEEVIKGTLSKIEAQEAVKEILLGPKNPDGTRSITTDYDFGSNGYFIVYSSTGDELLHPTLEGTNVWNVVDKNPKLDAPYYFVQDKIHKAIGGGGFTTYTWTYPFSEKLGEKIVYSKYDPNWGWIVTAGTYISDFNEDANPILSLTLFLISLVVLIGLVLSANYISSIATPLMTLEKAMKAAEYGEYKTVPLIKRKDEIGRLLKGYNHMIKAIKEAQTSIEYHAYYDMISGLPNKNKLENRMKRRMAEESLVGNLILIDVKDFGLINSLYGTSYGDRLIQEISSVLGDQALESYRISGNTFALWIDPVQEETINAFFKKMLIKFSSHLNQLGLPMRLDFYVSSSNDNKPHESFDDSYRRASVAMQYAKGNNLVNEVVSYREDMQRMIEDETMYKEELLNKLQTNEFFLVYQPIVDTKTSQVRGVEALARWNSSRFGYVSPGIFIPLLTKFNLIVQFSKFVIEKAMMDYNKLCLKYNQDLYLSLNISPIMFLQEDFENLVKKLIGKYSIPPEKIVLEITEDVFITDVQIIQHKISILNKMGVKISLDDFGTGYSSMNYLKNIHFDQIKIDKMFIDELHRDQRAYEMFKSIVGIAHTFGAKVVAEGVEEMEQVEIIKSAGCTLIQGYYYYKPEAL